MTKFPKEKIKQFYEAIANDIVIELQRVAPVLTSHLRENIIYRNKGKDIEIAMPYYGFYVEFGTAPHVIRPKNAKALMFPKSGGTLVRHKDNTASTKFTFGGKTVMTDVVFAKVVHHQGTRPQPFIRPTLRHKLGSIIARNLDILGERIA